MRDIQFFKTAKEPNEEPFKNKIQLATGMGLDLLLVNGKVWLRDKTGIKTIEGITDIKQVTTSHLKALAVKLSGEVIELEWDSENTLIHNAVIPNLENVTDAACSEMHKLFLCSDGRVIGRGFNLCGCLGQGENHYNYELVEISLPHKALQIATGESHSLFLLENGEVWACGNNSDAQCGGIVEDFLKNEFCPPFYEPIRVDLPQDSRAIKIAAGGKEFSACILDTGDLYTWGDSQFGQIGNGDWRCWAFTPVKVELPHKATELSLGDYHVLCLLENGAMYAWGRNRWGECGDGSDVYRFFPTLVDLPKDSEIVFICAGGRNFAITKQNTILGWGKRILAPKPIPELTEIIANSIQTAEFPSEDKINASRWKLKIL